MATRVFLNPVQKRKAIEKLGAFQQKDSSNQALEFSGWLTSVIEKRLGDIPGWQQASPIAIGSWGRGELCPASDLDVIFCGETRAILKVVREVENLGLKFRYRQPQDMEDWTKNVEVMEANALFGARPLSSQGHEKLEIQKNKILRKRKSFRRRLLKAMVAERKIRFKRYDSIANFLEPNLKFGTGGLRDLHQALILFHWFPERFQDEAYAHEVLQDHKGLFLLLRHKLHLTSGFDILTAGDQQDMANWLGYDNSRNFMKRVQKGLSQVNFYSDWASELCCLDEGVLNRIKSRKVKSWKAAFGLLQKDPSLCSQALVEKTLSTPKGFQKTGIRPKRAGGFLKKILDIRQEDPVTVAVFRSQLISHLIPGFKKVMGLVQHDQYHRFTVDAHLLQTIRETRRVYKNPEKLGKLEFCCEKLKVSDWNILRWVALYHDMAKGRGGDHHKKGRKLAEQDLRAFGFSQAFVEEVCWLVENHLVLSDMAFRKNPHSPQTWKELFSKGVRGERLYRLAVFTAIDIRATNLEAWSSWKESLLNELVENLANPSRERYFFFSQKVKARKLKIPEKFLHDLEPWVVDPIPHSVLLKDMEDILKKKDLGIRVVLDRKKQVWVRFHSYRDDRGLLYSFIQKLTGLGCNIRQAFIHTHKKMGIYDWFRVKTNKSISALRKQLSHDVFPFTEYFVSFSKIDLTSVSEHEWVFSFRARDKRGLLLTAIGAFYKQDIKIIWARVHTWGHQIDDVFGVLPKKGVTPEQILEALRQNLEREEAPGTRRQGALT